MAAKLKVLFVCEHNSARSQIAEAFLKAFAPERFEVKSTGMDPGALNPPPALNRLLNSYRALLTLR